VKCPRCNHTRCNCITAQPHLVEHPAPDLRDVTIIPFEADGPEALIGIPCAGFGELVEAEHSRRGLE
jgi:hypothetical protein